MGSTPSARPASVTILSCGVFILGVANIWRAVGWWQQWDLMTKLDATFPVILNLIMALFWGVVLSGLAIMLWWRHSMTRWAVPVALIVYALVRLAILLGVVVTLPAALAWVLPVTSFSVATVVATWVCWRPANRSYWHPDATG